MYKWINVYREILLVEKVIGKFIKVLKVFFIKIFNILLLVSFE